MGIIWNINNNIKTDSRINKLLYYNEIDCKVMYKIIEVLRNKYKIE